MDRNQRLLAGLLAIQLVLLVIVHPPFGRHAAAGSRTLLPALSSITPERLEITGGDSASVALVRRSGGWFLERPSGYPAMPGKVQKLIQDLEHLKAGNQVVSGRRYHAALKVADGDFERRLRIWDKPGGTPRLVLYVGTSPGADVTHMRVGGNDRVFEVAGMSAYDLPSDAGSWIDRNLVGWRAEDVSAIEVSNHRGRFGLEKRAGQWSVRSPSRSAGARLDQTKVRNLLGALCRLSVDQPAGKVDERAQGFTSPEATVVMHRTKAVADSTGNVAGASGAAAVTGPTQTLKFEIGAPVPDEKDQRYARRLDREFAVTVAQYVANWPDTVSLRELVSH